MGVCSSNPKFVSEPNSVQPREPASQSPNPRSLSKDGRRSTTKIVESISNAQKANEKFQDLQNIYKGNQEQNSYNTPDPMHSFGGAESLSLAKQSFNPQKSFELVYRRGTLISDNGKLKIFQCMDQSSGKLFTLKQVTLEGPDASAENIDICLKIVNYMKVKLLPLNHKNIVKYVHVTYLPESHRNFNG